MDAHEPLLTSHVFEFYQRPPRDLVWRLAYLTLLGASVLGGIYSILTRNPAAARALDPAYLDDPSHCLLKVGAEHLQLPSAAILDPFVNSSAILAADSTLPDQWSDSTNITLSELGDSWQGSHPGPRSLLGSPEDWSLAWSSLVSGQFHPKFIQDNPLTLFLSSCGAALLLAFLQLLLLQGGASCLVWMTVALQVLLPAGLGLILLAAGAAHLSLLFFALAVVLAWSYYHSRASLDLVARLLRLSAFTLHQNPSIAAIVLLLKLSLMAVSAFLAVCTAAAAANGSIVANPDRAYTPAARNMCIDAAGAKVPCCVWQASGWVGYYGPLVSATLLWSVILIFQVKVYTISGITAQWYFRPLGCPALAPPMFTSLGHALGPSLGSLCLGSLILSATYYVRMVLNNLWQPRQGEQQQLQGAGPGGDGGLRQRSLLRMGMSWALSCLLSLLEQITKFATVRMAITGEAFVTAGGEAVALLTRNAMDAYGVWWLPPLILWLSNLILSVAWGMTTYFLTYHYWATLTGSDPQAALQSAAVMGVLNLLLSWLMLSFASSLMLNVVDALFVCYAIDRDCGGCCRQDVHELYAALPGSAHAHHPPGQPYPYPPGSGGHPAYPHPAYPGTPHHPGGYPGGVPYGSSPTAGAHPPAPGTPTMAGYYNFLHPSIDSPVHGQLANVVYATGSSMYSYPGHAPGYFPPPSMRGHGPSYQGQAFSPPSAPSMPPNPPRYPPISRG